MTTQAKTPPSFFRTPSGDEIVILQREDYEQLLAAANGDPADSDADQDDLAIAKAKQAEWVAAGKPVVPWAVLKLVRVGDTYMRAFRKFRGFTQEELAGKTGIAQGFLSDIEGARKSASMGSLQKIAAALDMHISLLIPMAESTPIVEGARKDIRAPRAPRPGRAPRPRGAT